MCTHTHTYMHTCTAIAEKHAPMRQHRAKSDFKPWLTDQIKKLCYQRDFLKKQAVKFRSAAYDSAYKRHKNYVSRFGRQLTAYLIENLNLYKYLS